MASNQMMKNKRIKYLQSITTKLKNKQITIEVIKTYLFYNDVESARNHLKHHEFENKELTFLSLYIDVYEQNGKADQNELFNTQYVIDNLELFVKLLKHFKIKIHWKYLLEKEWPLTDLYLLYNISNRFELLERIVKSDPYVPKQMFFNYIKKTGEIYKKDIFRILSTRPCPWAFKIALENNWLNNE